MAFGRIYTRKNFDPYLDPPEIVEDSERLLRKKKEKVEKVLLYFKDLCLYLTRGYRY